MNGACRFSYYFQISKDLLNYTINCMEARKELCEREKLCEKRVRDGWFTYNTLELRQRYNIEGPMSADVDKAMAENMYEIQDKFRQRWSSHRCEIPGCPICAAVSAGVKLFHNSNIQLVTGCTRNPGTRSKYCKDHREHEVPCILSKDIEQLALLKKEKNPEPTLSSMTGLTKFS